MMSTVGRTWIDSEAYSPNYLHAMRDPEEAGSAAKMRSNRFVETAFASAVRWANEWRTTGRTKHTLCRKADAAIALSVHTIQDSVAHGFISSSVLTGHWGAFYLFGAGDIPIFRPIGMLEAAALTHNYFTRFRSVLGGWTRNDWNCCIASAFKQLELAGPWGATTLHALGVAFSNIPDAGPRSRPGLFED